MKKIPLTRGKFALVDDEDYLYLNRFNWHLGNDGLGHYYAVRVIHGRKKGVKNFHINMSDMVIGTGKGVSLIAHKNRDTLDYRKKNLYIGGWSSTRHNQIKPQPNKSSKYRGVGLKKGVTGKKGGLPWRMMIQKNRVQEKYKFKTEIEAAIAYNKRARELYGEMAYQNKIDMASPAELKKLKKTLRRGLKQARELKKLYQSRKV